MTAFAHILPVQGIAANEFDHRDDRAFALHDPFLATPVVRVIAVRVHLVARGQASGCLRGRLFSIASFLPTIVANVPMNDGLPQSTQTERTPLWASCLKDWTWWNHISTIASLLASIAFVRAHDCAPTLLQGTGALRTGLRPCRLSLSVLRTRKHFLRIGGRREQSSS